GEDEEDAEHDVEDNAEGEDDEMNNGIAEMVEENERLQKFFEVSSFLAEWSRVITRAMEGLEVKLNKSLADQEEQEQAQQVLVKSLTTIVEAQIGRASCRERV